MYHLPMLGASPQGGCFHISSSLILLSSVSKMCDTFSNRDLTSEFYEVTKDNSDSLYYSGRFFIAPDNL